MHSLLCTLLLAASTTPGGPGSPEEEAVPWFRDPFMMLILLAGFMFISWQLIVSGPQKKQQQARQAELDAVRKGDRVVTIGGIHGKVLAVHEGEGGAKTVTLAITKGEIEVSHAAVSSITRGKGEKTD